MPPLQIWSTEWESGGANSPDDERLSVLTAKTTVQLTKHHGLGNDFLIAVSPPRALDATDAIALCDRRRGFGADGLISLEQLGEDVWSMILWNSDGSRPEVSGNGLRCVGQALFRHLDLTEEHRFTVRTDGGMRTLDVQPDRRAKTAQVRVDMGPAVAGPPPSNQFDDMDVAVQRQQGVSIGNPHLVALVDDAMAYDIRTVGPVVEADYPDGINVHLINVTDRQSLRLSVWERGAGYTEACGSGACAAAWAARQWDLVEQKVNVAMPGGSATVELGDAELPDTVFLTGPATFVGTIEVS